MNLKYCYFKGITNLRCDPFTLIVGVSGITFEFIF